MLIAVMLAMTLIFTPSMVFGQEEAPVLTSPGFDPLAYIGQGNAYNCADFGSQADAQAVLRADPTDPNKLDTDRPKPDGVACESNPAPFDRVPVPR
jgi:hypothetical protein